jgi:hypothetical protein
VENTTVIFLDVKLKGFTNVQTVKPHIIVQKSIKQNATLYTSTSAMQQRLISDFLHYILKNFF